MDFAKLNEVLSGWIEEHKFDLVEDVETPFVDDYALVVAVRDLDNGGSGGLAILHTHGITTYGLRGLLETALDDAKVTGQACYFDDGGE